MFSLKHVRLFPKTFTCFLEEALSYSAAVLHASGNIFNASFS